MCKRTRVLGLLAAVSLVVAACGSSDDDDGGATGGDDATSSEESAPAEDTAASEDTSSDDSVSQDTAASEDTAAEGETSDTEADGGGEDADVAYDPDAELRVAFLITPVSLDPHSERHVGDRHALYPIWDTLVQLADDGSVQPSVAESWEFNEAGDVLTFTLRDDVVFHDGTPVTAEAVKLSIERLQTSDEVSLSVASSVDEIESVEAPDDTTLVINLSSPSAVVLVDLAAMAGAIINPEYLDADLTVPPAEAGSGPFVVSDFTPDVSVTYERAPNVWQDGAAKVQTMVIDAYPDAQAGLNALETDQVDLAYARVDGEAFNSVLDRNDEFVLSVSPSVGARLHIRDTLEPLDDVRVRQAIFHGINNADIAEFGYGEGTCETADQYAPEGTVAYVDGYEGYPYDPERAKELLAEAGAESFELELMIPGGQVAEERSAQIIQQQLGEVGIDVVITTVQASDGPGEFAKGDAGALLSGGGGGADAPSAVMRTMAVLAMDGPQAGEVVDAMNATSPPGDDREERIDAAFETMMDYAVIDTLCFTTARWMNDGTVVGADPVFLASLEPYDPTFMGIEE